MAPPLAGPLASSGYSGSGSAGKKDETSAADKEARASGGPRIRKPAPPPSLAGSKSPRFRQV